MPTNESPAKYEFHYGASWMDLQGYIYVVRGFHDEWISSHPELAGGATSVSELIMSKRWLSIVVYSKGYVEICLSDINDAEVVETLHSFLAINKGKWENLLVMPMVEEGFIQLSASDFDGLESFRTALSKAAAEKIPKVD
jgi:hypothetical protein